MPFIQAVLGGTIILEVFLAFRLMPLGDATTLMFTNPAFTAIFACCCLPEARLRLWKITCIAMLLCGMVMVMQPPLLFGEKADSTHNLAYFAGACLALLCALSSGLLTVIVAGPLSNVKIPVLVFHVGWASLLIGIACCLGGAEQRFFSSAVTTISHC